MKPTYPKLLSWQAKKARIPFETAAALWIEAVKEATDQSDLIESSDYWKAAVGSLNQRISVASQIKGMAPFGWGIWFRLPATQWQHGLSTMEAMFSIGLRACRDFQHRA